jgi:hypothetical protein
MLTAKPASAIILDLKKRPHLDKQNVRTSIGKQVLLNSGSPHAPASATLWLMHLGVTAAWLLGWQAGWQAGWLAD